MCSNDGDDAMLANFGGKHSSSHVHSGRVAHLRDRDYHHQPHDCPHCHCHGHGHPHYGKGSTLRDQHGHHHAGAVYSGGRHESIPEIDSAQLSASVSQSNLFPEAAPPPPPAANVVIDIPADSRSISMCRQTGH